MSIGVVYLALIVVVKFAFALFLSALYWEAEKASVLLNDAYRRVDIQRPAPVGSMGLPKWGVLILFVCGAVMHFIDDVFSMLTTGSMADTWPLVYLLSHGVLLRNYARLGRRAQTGRSSIIFPLIEWSMVMIPIMVVLSGVALVSDTVMRTDSTMVLYTELCKELTLTVFVLMGLVAYSISESGRNE